MKSIQELPAMSGHNHYGMLFAKLDLKRQLALLLEELGNEHLVRNKVVGTLTATARGNVCFQALEVLRENGLPIKNILNLKQKHIKAIVSNWRTNKLAASTIQTRFSIMRWMAASIGKPGLILTPAVYGVDDSEIARSYIATYDHSWEAKADKYDLFSRANEMDPWVGINFEMMDAFGLRVNESVLMRPLMSDQESALLVEEGTKGGRMRTVPIENELQRNVLERAKEFANLSEFGAMISPGKNATQMKNRIYYICKKLGIARSKLGITPHGLRHGYANDKYEKESGVPSVVRGGPVVLDRALDARARQAVTEALGHSRLNITGAYTGKRMQGRPRNSLPSMAP